MTKLEKVKKLIEKYGLSIDDLLELDDEKKEEEIKEEPKTTETETETTKVEEPKETEKVVEKKEEVEKEDVEKKTDNFSAIIETLRAEIESLKETVANQNVKTDKAYEILAAQGEKVEEDPYKYEQKLGSCDIKPNFANSEEGADTFAKQLSSKKIR